MLAAALTMKKWLTTLIDNPRKTLRLFALGAVLFVVGVGCIQWANYQIAPSLQQEIVALAGLLIGGSGFVLAISAQCLLIASRVKHMGN
jgi:uncharacterized protein YjeT (DUF2065 family)